MSLDITQLIGLHPAIEQHQPIRPVTERRSTAPVRKDLVDVPNPWGVTPGEAGVLDALIVHGSNKGAAIALGLTLKTVEILVSKGTQRLPHGPRLHKLLRWRDFRGLMQELKP